MGLGCVWLMNTMRARRIEVDGRLPGRGTAPPLWILCSLCSVEFGPAEDDEVELKNTQRGDQIFFMRSGLRI